MPSARVRELLRRGRIDALTSFALASLVTRIDLPMARIWRHARLSAGRDADARRLPSAHVAAVAAAAASPPAAASMHMMASAPSSSNRPTASMNESADASENCSAAVNESAAHIAFESVEQRVRRPAFVALMKELEFGGLLRSVGFWRSARKSGSSGISAEGSNDPADPSVAAPLASSAAASVSDACTVAAPKAGPPSISARASKRKQVVDL